MGRSLLLLLLLLAPLADGETGSVCGRIVLLKRGAPQSDASSSVVWIEGPGRKTGPAGAVRAEMASASKRFVPRVVVVPKDALVEFPNSDPIFHNVFSVSKANRFDLGLYRRGASKKKRFDEAGLVRVYCNIHPQMVGFVMVVDSDFAAVTGTDGSFRFDGVPAGQQVLKAWHEEGGEARVSLTVRPGQDSAATVRLDASGYRPQPHKNKYGKNYPPQAGESDDERY